MADSVKTASELRDARNMSQALKPEPHNFLTVHRRILEDGGPPELQAQQEVFFYVFEDRDDEAYIVQLQQDAHPTFEYDIRYSIALAPLMNRSPALDAERKACSRVVVRVNEAKKNALWEAILPTPQALGGGYQVYSWAVRCMHALYRRLYEKDNLTDEQREALIDKLDNEYVSLEDLRRVEGLMLNHAF